MLDNKDKKKSYTYEDMERLARTLKFEYEKKLAEQKERIFDLREQVKKLEEELSEYKERSRYINKALIAACSKAEELEAAARQKYNMELNSLKMFHNKWLGYYQKIIAKYPVDDELIKAAKFNDKMNKIFELGSDSATAQVLAMAQKKSDAEIEREALEAIRTAAKAAVKEEEEQDNTPEKTYESEKNRLGIKDGFDAASQGQAAAKPFEPLNKIKRYYESKKSGASNYFAEGTNGFSLAEALNPTQTLAELIKDVLGEEDN